ncbi:MAG: hypothetical protein WCL04_03185 [Verrucomicrobiota bacterium]
MTEGARVLKEFHNVRQEPAGGRRRWFDGDRMELVVWYDTAGAISGFQLCYVLVEDEFALTWRRDAGLSHNRVDGEDPSTRGQTPLLVAACDVPWEEIEMRFQAESAELEPAVRELVAARLATRD